MRDRPDEADVERGAAAERVAQLARNVDNPEHRQGLLDYAKVIES